MAESFFLGILIITLLFFICAFLTLGAKITYYYIISNLKEKKKIAPSKVEQPPASNTQAKKPRKRTYKPIRSIEINPEEVDRVYFKKSS